jgi:hypothetical protein
LKEVIEFENSIKNNADNQYFQMRNEKGEIEYYRDLESMMNKAMEYLCNH